MIISPLCKSTPQMNKPTDLNGDTRVIDIVMQDHIFFLFNCIVRNLMSVVVVAVQLSTKINTFNNLHSSSL